jgi:hypothetical protein
MGVFSTLNNITDISPMKEYGEICGLTEAEIIKYFPEYLEETANKYKISPDELITKMRNYYNGFCFDISGKHRLYNSYSTLRLFFAQIFSDYWIESGGTSIISKYLKKQNLTVEQFRNFPVTEDFISSSVEIEKAPPESFLYQTGYLSLRRNDNDKLVLDFPNTEVLNAMSAMVSQNILEDSGESFNYCRRDLLEALESLDYKELISVLNRLLASIPYNDYTPAAIKSIKLMKYIFTTREWLYRSNILCFLHGCGVVVIPEMHTNLGCTGLVLSHRGKIWVIEIKVAYKGQSPKRKAKEAIRQIANKNYAKPYPDAFCIGLAIDDTVRQIKNW